MKTRTKGEVDLLAHELGYSEKLTVTDAEGNPVKELVPHLNNDGSPIIVDGKPDMIEVTKTEDNPQPKEEYLDGVLDAHLDGILKRKAFNEAVKQLEKIML